MMTSIGICFDSSRGEPTPGGAGIGGGLIQGPETICSNGRIQVVCHLFAPRSRTAREAALGEEARQLSVLSGSGRPTGRSETALEVVHQGKQAKAFEGAVASADRGLEQDAGLLEPLERSQHTRLRGSGDLGGRAQVDNRVRRQRVDQRCRCRAAPRVACLLAPTILQLGDTFAESDERG
jgi:hypothetical protein